MVCQAKLEDLARQFLPGQAEGELLIVLRVGAVINNGGVKLKIVIVKLYLYESLKMRAYQYLWKLRGEN